MKTFPIAITMVLLMVPTVFGVNTRSWVSSTGSDANSCVRTQPCATFQGALANTASPGEIDVVDPGEYGTVLISGRTLTIDGGGMARVEVSGKGIAISIQSGSMVTVRNLAVHGAGGEQFGILVDGTSRAVVDHVSISDLTVIYSNWAFNVQSGGQATLSNSTLEGAVYCIYSLGTLTVNNSLLTGCTTAVQTYGGSVLLRENTIVGNGTGLAASAGSIISFKNNGVYNNTTNGNPTLTVNEE